MNLHSSMSRQQNSVTWSSLARPTFTSRYQRTLGHVVYIIVTVSVSHCMYIRKQMSKSTSQADAASREMQDAQTRRNCVLKKTKHSEKHLVINFSLTQSETQKIKNVIV